MYVMEGYAMKIFAPFAVAVTTALLVAGCAKESPNSPGEEGVAIANPASVFCVKQGGVSSIVEDEAGNQRGVCTLKDGSRHDEWDYFRANSK